MSAAEREGPRIRASNRKGWIKQLSARYSGRIEEVAEDSVLYEEEHEFEQITYKAQHEHTHHTEIVGSLDPPAEWQDTTDPKKSTGFDSISSEEVDSTVETDLAEGDAWRLTERDNETLEADMKKVVGELKDADLASDEESLRADANGNLEKKAEEKKAKRISSPTAFPSNFTSIRAGKATEMFTERMKSIEKKNDAKAKAKLKPVIATIGRFSSAFRKFESSNERRHSLETSTSISEFKAQHPTVSASASISTKTNIHSPPPAECKKLPRTPYNSTLFEPLTNGKHGTSEKVKASPKSPTSPPISSPSKLIRTPLDLTVVSGQVSPRMKSSVKTSRSAAIPLESSRLMRNVCESGNAPDVVAATFLPDLADKTSCMDGRHTSTNIAIADSISEQSRSTLESGPFESYPNDTDCSLAGVSRDRPDYRQISKLAEKESPHFDIDIVIQRDPLPATTSANDFSTEPATTAITLGRDEVTVMKIDSFNPNSIVAPSEVITVWDTEVPVKDTHEKVIPPTKLHVTHLNKDILPPRSIEQPISRDQSIEHHAFSQDSRVNSLIDYREKRHDNETQMEPVMVTIRPHPISQWPNHASEIKRSKGSEEQNTRQMRSSVVIQPKLKVLPLEETPDGTQLSLRERASSKKRPKDYNAPSTDLPKEPDHEFRDYRSQPKHSHHRPTTSRSRPEASSSAHGYPYHHQPQREHIRTTEQQNVASHRQRETNESYYRSNYGYDRRCVDESYEDSATLVPPVVNEKMKSTSLDDLRMLREGLVADTKSVFSSTKEPGKQYFGERLYAASTQRPPRSVEESDYTREWVERESSKQPLPMSINNKVQSPVREEKKDSSWCVDRSYASPPRGRGGTYRRRTRSLGRAAPKSKAILQMAKFFQDEAEMGATHREPSVSEDELQSASVIDMVESTTSRTAASRASMDDIYRPRTSAHWQSHENKAPINRKPHIERKVEQQHMEPQNKNKNLQRQQPKSSMSGVGSFIDAYNELDAEAQDGSFSRKPRKTLIVREEKLRDTREKKTSHAPRIIHPAVETETDVESVDDRPLAASAFKAFLGSDNHLTPLEQSVEQAYQTSIRLDREQRVMKAKVGQRPSVQPAPPKAEPWWKQENERARQRQASEERARAKKKPALVASSSLDSLPVHQAHAGRVNEPPYANYHAQVDRYNAEAERNEQVEDYYAQIRKKPAAERTVSLPTTSSQEQQLYVQVAPPKPKRNSAYQSNTSLNDQHAPELPERQELMQPLHGDHQPEVADDRMYSNPYSEPEKPTDQLVDQQTQQPAEEFDNRYAPQPGPAGVERGMAREGYPEERQSYTVEERRIYQEQLPRENRLYRQDEPMPQSYPSWNTRKYPHGSWQDLSTMQPQPADYRWNRDPGQPDWRVPVDYRPQERPAELRYPQPVREWHDARPDPRWQDPRQDSRYNTWSDREEYDRSRLAMPDSRQHNTLPYPEAKSNSYRMAHPQVRSLERHRNGELRPDVLPAERTADRRPRRAKSVPITRPSQQKHSKGADTKQSKHKHPSKHDTPRLSRQDKQDDKLGKGQKFKERPSKSGGHKEGMIKHVPQIPIDTAPMPDFIPSHYFSEQPFGNPHQPSYGPQAMPGPQLNQIPPQMTYNQLTYNQPPNQIPYSRLSTNQIPYNQQPSNHMQYNLEPYRRAPANQRPMQQNPPDQYLANENAYNKHMAYTAPNDRPRPGVGVMFDPRVGATDF
ncbi:uncharacterized protein [Watersipora subatra]|uniref:uncharacterized protein n=1 Tax=Watersipora subatra TaxID=2589382 RepID=UPI00355BC09F